MDVKQAVTIAKNWVIDVLKDENITNVGLEEVRFDDVGDVWLITIGFSRPWNTTRDAMTVLSGSPTVRRSYRVVSVNDSDGAVVSMSKTDVGD